jgi:hypothetical protein
LRPGRQWGRCACRMGQQGGVRGARARARAQGGAAGAGALGLHQGRGGAGGARARFSAGRCGDSGGLNRRRESGAARQGGWELGRAPAKFGLAAGGRRRGPRRAGARAAPGAGPWPGALANSCLGGGGQRAQSLRRSLGSSGGVVSRKARGMRGAAAGPGARCLAPKGCVRTQCSSQGARLCAGALHPGRRRARARPRGACRQGAAAVGCVGAPRRRGRRRRIGGKEEATTALPGARGGRAAARGARGRRRAGKCVCMPVGGRAAAAARRGAGGRGARGARRGGPRRRRRRQQRGTDCL